MNLTKIQNLYNYILRYRVFLIIFIISISFFNVLNLNKFKLDASADTLILENDNDYKIFKEYSKIFPSSQFLILAYIAKNASIDKEYINNIAELKNKIELIKGVESTFSIIDAPIIKSQNITLNNISLDNIKTLMSDGIDLKTGLNELRNNPIFQNQLINKDANVSSIIIYLEDDKKFMKTSNLRDDLKNKLKDNAKNERIKNELKKVNINYEDLKENYNNNRHKLIVEIRNIIKESGYNKNLYLGGIAMIADDSLEFVKKDIINFGIGVTIFIIIILTFLFKNIKWVILPLITTSFSILSIISLLGIIGWKVTVISSNFISLIIILTISMNVHIIVRYQLIANRNNNNVNIGETMKEMFLPCIYTSLTTIVAFLSLVFSDIRPVIDFGWIMSIGLLVTFLSSFIVLPTLISFFPKTNNFQNTNIHIINLLFKLVIKYGNQIIIINLILLLIAIWGITKLKVENSFINYFKEKTEIYKGMKIIDRELGGTTPLDIIVEFNNNEKNDISINTNDDESDLSTLFVQDEPSIENWLTPDKLETINEIHQYLNNKEEVGKVQSIQSFINYAEQINNNKLTSFELAILYKTIPKEIKDDLLGPYLSLDKNLVRFNARIIDSKDIKRNELIKNIEKDLNSNFSNIQSIKVNGLLVLYNNMLQSLFSSQIKSLIFVLIAIFIMFLILFKSFFLSIAAIIPNIFAAIFIIGLIGIFKIPLDMMTITIAAITIGIAVDNSIHYIYRIKKELQNKNTLIDSIRECHLTVGSAILITSMTIAFGFSILLLSNFLPTIYFGIFTSIAMFVAMLGIMTTLPRLLILFKKKNINDVI